MKRRLFFAPAFLLCLSISFSQTNTAKESLLNIPKEVSLEEKLAGTYEVIPNNFKVTEVFTTEMLQTIEAKREEHQDVVYKYSEYTTLRIYSRSKINSPDFKRKKN
ncbi:MAG: hypothetical protein ACXVNO_07330 [Bacteroidia bacterium]